MTEAFSIPGPWHALILVMAAFRVCRLIGWDDLPPIARARAWVIGEHWVPDLDDVADDLGLPGKQPHSEVGAVRPAYRRPLLAHFVHCPFCLGWWISVVVYAAWLLEPTGTLYALVPFAISGAVGLISKNWDA